MLWIAADTSHKQNHAIKETCSGIRRNLYYDLARDHKRAGGDAAPNALRFTNHRRRFPCNSGLLYRRETLDDFTVTRNDLLGFYDYSVPGPHAERGGAGRLSRRRYLEFFESQLCKIQIKSL
jgi:hypothetical protein